jgi:hypothetical protein
MSPYERGGSGNAGLGCGYTTLGGVTPPRGKGALGTVMAMLVTPPGTLSPVTVVNGADG